MSRAFFDGISNHLSNCLSEIVQESDHAKKVFNGRKMDFTISGKTSYLN
jgi:hypothetical protein